VRTSGSIGASLAAIFTKRKLDAEMLDDLEEVVDQSRSRGRDGCKDHKGDQQGPL